MLATQLCQQKLLTALSEKVRRHDLWGKKIMLQGDILREHTLIFIILLSLFYLLVIILSILVHILSKPCSLKCMHTHRQG